MDEATSAARALNEFRRHDPPKFKGEHDSIKADLWLQEIKKIFEILHCPDNAKVEYATYLMIGEAEYWWRGAKKMMETNHEELTWEAFKNKFLEKYFPKSARAGKEAQFLTLYQGNLTIAEYAAKEGHKISECPIRPRVCYICQKPDHFANECPERKDDRAVNRNNINDNVVRPTAKGRVYHINGEETSSSSELIQGECLIAGKSLNVIYDSGATHSFISLDWVDSLQLIVTTLPFDLVVTLPSTESHVEVILGMDWLSSHYVLLDCACKFVIFPDPDVSRFLDTNKLNFSLKGEVQKCVSLNSVSTKLEVEVDGILVVEDFLEVFPLDVPGLPPVHDIEFSIDVTPGT
ncbi:uncharacterized protein [Cicer arietinum]|uniref:uncharacterized protein n=1 Tax=Cicer arietinum TaxID=3827 RepID=UPI003CC61578